MAQAQRRINLLRGWPAPDLLPAQQLSAAAQRVLADWEVFTMALEYGPSAGYQGLRTSLARWLGGHYEVDTEWRRICVTGGASQSIGCILQSFTDPVYTRAVWLVAPCYHLACGMFHDAGFQGRLHAVSEDDEGIDIEALEEKIRAFEEQEKNSGTSQAKVRKQF
jgi:DNA-binding transcriptional MocR family regulator